MFMKPHSVTYLMKAHTYISSEGEIPIRILSTSSRFRDTAPALPAFTALLTLAP